ncbi:ABC transporter substrate-binding protein [Natrinema salsiterrestre]|uniref:ABC transporter substrate-binding protein n=1 Tax=Natrinema salsiterrestre TaxID=2950540 RepID=A0A9Q4L4E1_9EURY|nr:ABC transporter substrate-binding protein [Natrinema salsiterrestre]MDF9747412.1 ABC transporter substrate-binding protein [Natrinema salsiterrestre]
MTDERSWTRRDVIRTSSAIAGMGVLAGCTGGGSEGGPSDGDSYTVTMEPVGEVEFPDVPETWVANNGSWADMGIALGQEPPEGVWLPSRYHTQYYDEIPDVSVSKDGMTRLSDDGIDPETFYELDGDVHVIDPNFLTNRFGDDVSESDIEDIERDIAPFFGNSIFSTGYPWHEDYAYLSLYEAFGKLAEVFQETERYEEFVSLHDEFQSNVADIVPSEGERPTVAIMWAVESDMGSFSPYLIGEGTSFKQWRELKVNDAFADTDVRDFHSTRGKIDYETLLEIDPEIILFRGQEAKTAAEFRDEIVSQMEDDDTARELTAVQNDDVYRGGPLYQGPITNLVVTQRAAEQLYDVDEQLYDPQRVSDIVNGNF